MANFLDGIPMNENTPRQSWAELAHSYQDEVVKLKMERDRLIYEIKGIERNGGAHEVTKSALSKDVVQTLERIIDVLAAKNHVQFGIDGKREV